MKTLLTLLVSLCVDGSVPPRPKGNFVDGQCSPNDGYDVFPDKSQSGAQFQDTVSPDYSLLWAVEYFDSYKVLTNTRTGDVHVLTQCGIPPPDANDLPAGATFVEVPIVAAATTSTTYIPLVEMLGERARLRAYGSPFEYVSSPCLRKMYRDGAVESAYDAEAGARDDAMLESLGVDVTFADEFSKDAFNAYVMTDTHEEAPNAVLKTAEYVEVAGLFFNREKEATAIIERTIANYLCTQAAAEAALGGREPVKVFWSQYNPDGGWSIPSENTWYAELVAAAGGELILADGVEPDLEDSFGFKYLSTPQVVGLTADAEVWISPGPWVDNQAPSKGWAGTVRVFDNQGPRGANDWFERRVVEPDTMLQDLAVALHPDAFPDLDRKWLRDVSADEEIGGVSDDELDAACPDVYAPYVFEGADLCKDRNGGGSKKKKKKGVSGADVGMGIGIAVAVLAGLLLLAYCCSLGQKKKNYQHHIPAPATHKEKDLGEKKVEDA